mmetsp:Transcript_33542/g.61740  ORF Transcript_33542/g.61740 Transcript_33542/m.61740 type:complete len:397 (-) Transcript_33542:4-1194(-)
MKMGAKILWRPSSHEEDHDDDDDNDGDGTTATIRKSTNNNTFEKEELEFYRIRNLRRMDEILKDQDAGKQSSPSSSLIVTTPPQRPLTEIINESLVIGQEIALTSILLAVHREIVVHEEQLERLERHPNKLDISNHGPVDYLSEKSSLAMLTVYATLPIIVYYNRQSSSSATTRNNNNDQQQHRRRKKAIVRLSDGLLLAALLRFISGVLRTLTASYSTDTVYALAITGMAIHLLACDYDYANGILPSGDNAADGVVVPPPPSNASSDRDHPRPAFQGGTVSLNAAFFSTVLLVSRIKSNATSYLFVSSVVTLFAFYPASRHNIAGSYPNTIWASPCSIVTFTLSLAAWLLLSSFEKILFASLQLSVFVISPGLQWRLQRHKQIITGPWDIAHIQR